MINDEEEGVVGPSDIVISYQDNLPEKSTDGDDKLHNVNNVNDTTESTPNYSITTSSHNDDTVDSNILCHNEYNDKNNATLDGNVPLVATTSSNVVNVTDNSSTVSTSNRWLWMQGLGATLLETVDRIGAPLV